MASTVGAARGAYWGGEAWVVWLLLVLVLAFAFSPYGYYW